MSCKQFVPWKENSKVCESCRHLEASCLSSIDLDMDHALAKVFQKAIVSAFPGIASNVPRILIGLGRKGEADYQCNNAMGLAKQLSDLKPPLKMPPLEVAKKIKEHIGETNGLIASVEPTKQGFININVGISYVQRALEKLTLAGVQPPAVKKQRILIDFSSPNIAKTMHVGHLRSTIIGDSICRLFEFCGHEVHRVNHVGDWGTQFGMLIAHLKRECPSFLTTPPDITNLVAFYKAAKIRFDEDADFKQQSYREVVALQSGDADNLKAWDLICDISRKEFSVTYDKLNVTLKEVGESYYNPIIPDVIKKLEANGQVTVSEGARIITLTNWMDIKKVKPTHVEQALTAFLINPKGKVKINPLLLAEAERIGAAEKAGDDWSIKAGGKTVMVSAMTNEDADKFVKGLQKITKPISEGVLAALENAGYAKKAEGMIAVPAFPIPLIVTKSDGGFSYDTTDMAAVWYRTQDVKVNRAIYVTDLGQENHFRMVFRAAEDAGWTTHDDGSKIRLDHVGFGTVNGPDGKKYKTRSGDVASLADLLQEACEKAYEIAKERQAEKIQQAAERNASGDLREKFVPFTEEEMRSNAEAVGLGAIKYCDLRQNRNSNYIFSSDKMCSLEGNTAMYMQYAYARICSINRKANCADFKKSQIVLELTCEKNLGLCLLRFASVVEKTVCESFRLYFFFSTEIDVILKKTKKQKQCDNLMPHNITDYLFQLVSCFNDCYNNRTEWKVVGHPLQNSRLQLCEATAVTLKKGLELIGIVTVDKI